MLIFQLHYHANANQQICICGSTSAFGNFDESKAFVLFNDGDCWLAEIEMENIAEIKYYYLVKENDTIVRREWGNPRKLLLESEKTYLIHDWWKSQPPHAYLFSSLFTQSIFAHEKTNPPKNNFSRTILLHVICPYVKKDEMLVISGNCNALGSWNLSHSSPLSPINDCEWQILLNADEIPHETQYKFIIINKKTHEVIKWEDGENRTIRRHCGLDPQSHRFLGIAGQARNDGGSVIAETGLFFHYQNFTFKGAGTAIPLFSIRTNESFGIGDFIDLRKTIDWASHTNQQLIQILPVNDTTTTKTWRDSYPYSAISIYALHPIYLGCNEFPLKNKQKERWYAEEGKYLNAFSEIDYEKVLRLKIGYARALYIQDGETVLSSPAYKLFYENNQSWLFPYACF